MIPRSYSDIIKTASNYTLTPTSVLLRCLAISIKHDARLKQECSRRPLERFSRYIGGNECLISTAMDNPGLRGASRGFGLLVALFLLTKVQPPNSFYVQVTKQQIHAFRGDYQKLAIV